MKRASGILLPAAALPSRYGIGGFSKEAYQFIDDLKTAGQRYWQILPLGPTGYGDSPYQSFSTFAGNPYYISLEKLTEEGLLTEEECREADCGEDPRYVDYEKIYHTRFSVLKKAYHRFGENDAYRLFIQENEDWLEDYVLYTAIKKEQGGISWMEWPETLKFREEKTLLEKRKELAEELGFYRFLQYEFSTQWENLKAYAGKQDVKIIGDIPIYVAMDSADAWAEPGLFQFDGKLRPAAVAGCPPDAFAATGQLWGNPLYDWEYHRKTGYGWWIRRMRHCMKLCDMIRIDHFRGFAGYYSIPYGEDTAINGHWETGPGLEFFRVLEEQLGEISCIAEDLGFLTEDVREMVYSSGFPGMKVLQFAFDSGPGNEYLPHHYDHNCVVYTGTHDNDTTAGWYDSQREETRRYVREYCDLKNAERREICRAMIRLAMGSVADLSVIPMQDILGLGTEARYNYPSTLGNNWKWRMQSGDFSPELQKEMRETAETYGRA